MTVQLRTPNTDLEIITLPDGQPHINVPDYWNPRLFPEDRYIIDVRGGTWQDLGATAVALDVLRRYNVPEEKIALWLPFLPGARQDRGVPLTCKVYADFINNLRCSQVICIDPHSSVMPALLNNLTIIEPANVAPYKFFKDVDAVVCPDQGAIKRAEQIADRFDKPVIYCKKKRDPQTGKLSGFECSETLHKTKSYVVVDDICDGGGTFIGLADVLDHPRERLHLWVTHGIFSNIKNLVQLDDRFGRIGCTNSYLVQGTPCADELFDITDLMQRYTR